MINQIIYGKPMPQIMTMAIIIGLLALGPCLTTRSIAADQLSSGTSNKQIRIQSAQSIPYHLLNRPTKNKIDSVVKKPSLFRRLPVTSINANPEYFKFLVRYPEVIVGIWQLMGVTKVTTERTAPFVVTTDDGNGTLSSLELLYGSDNLHLFYGTGTYEGPVLKRKLKGQCVLVLRTDNQRNADGEPVVTSQLDVFIKIENATAGLVAKSIQPLVGPTADHNFVESLKFVQRLNETTENNGPGVQRMGARLNIDADVRDKFSDVVEVVFQEAIANATGQPAGVAYQENAVSKYTTLAKPPQTLSQFQHPSNSRQPTAGYSMPQTNVPGRQGPAQYRFGDTPTSQTSSGTRRFLLPPRGRRAPQYSTEIYPQQPASSALPVQAGYDDAGNRAKTSAVKPTGWQPFRK